MLLEFKVTDNDFTCLNAGEVPPATNIDYVKCHFTFESQAWNNLTARVAVFKSATYNIYKEVLLDSFGYCFIDPEIYKRGGIVQVTLYGDRYSSHAPDYTTSMTEVLELQFNANLVVPAVPPTPYQIAVAEMAQLRTVVIEAIEDLQQRADSGEFDGKGIETVAVNSDGTLTITFTDGTSVVSEYSLKGDPGEAGVGISYISFGLNDTCTIHLTDGSSYTSDSLLGPAGPSGIGISNVYFDSDLILHIILDNGNEYTSGVTLKGEKGDDSALLNLVDGAAEGSVRSILANTDPGSGPGRGAMSIGVNTKAYSEASHAEGQNTTATDIAAHAEGAGTYAQGYTSHAEGYYTKARGDHSHAECYDTEAIGTNAHSEGSHAVAFGHNSHAQNYGTYSQGHSQTVIGEYNVKQGTQNSRVATDNAFIIGNGTSDNDRSDAFAIRWDGAIVLADGTVLTVAQLAKVANLA